MYVPKIFGFKVCFVPISTAFMKPDPLTILPRRRYETKMTGTTNPMTAMIFSEKKCTTASERIELRWTSDRCFLRVFHQNLT